jgi:hypothetical protein
VFILLQLFNEINCRKVGSLDFNVLERFFHNPTFLVVLFGTAALQFVLVNYLGFLVSAVSLSKNEWGVCVFLGFTALIVAPLAKLAPDSLLDRVPIQKLIDEDRLMDNKVLRAWNGVAQPSDNYHALEDPDDENELDKSEEKGEGARPKKSGHGFDDDFQTAP